MTFRRKLAYTAATVTGVSAIGGATLYNVLRPRAYPGDNPKPITKPPIFPTLPSRKQHLENLRNAKDPFDVLIIGGGATGSGIALDAASRGLTVAMIERDDFAAGTSSKSTKLVHGGVRYLEKAFWDADIDQYNLVKEALKERTVFLHTAPHLSAWLPIMLPVYEWWKAPYYWAGTKAYDALAKLSGEGIESSYFLTRGKALEAFPMLKREKLCGALVYYDGAHNDSRMNVTIAMTAALYGATLANHANVTSLLKDPATGQVNGATVQDVLDPSAKPISVRAKCVINATGPYTDTIRKMDDGESREIVAPSSGVHIVLPGYYSPRKMGLLDANTSDGRVIFFLPWEGNTIAGTTDAPTEIVPQPVPKEEEIQFILNEVSRYLAPDINVRRGDVLAAWSGIRPLVRDPKAKNTESLVRNHLIDISNSGLLTIAGGKWTTYRQMAEESLDIAIEKFELKPHPKPLPFYPTFVSENDADSAAASAARGTYGMLEISGDCNTDKLKLIGSHGWSPTLFINLIQHFGVDTVVAQHLASAYGDRAWTVASLCSPTNLRFPVRGNRISPLYPFVDGEIRYAVRHEMAETAVDVIARRTRLAFLNAQAALESLPLVIDTMGEEMGWGKKRKEKEWTEAVKFLESMGLADGLQGITRSEVEKGRVAQWSKEVEGGMYSRFSGPAESV
ncbi:mitochondrial glycerol-3-phosphate dehydrogenase [Arthrobotrys musiformis]|uniref:Glycerol-3-phosphate dehydrogenase n=1 Tax=Arthrobotrys musiformis TaxID=47236 RepID=A0AAV9VYC8_9PEZI